MEGNKVFLDTNILIYAYNITAGDRHQQAVNIMEDLWRSGIGVLSTQVLQEFFVVVTKKIPKPVDMRSAKEIIKDLLKWYVVTNDGESILDAIDIHQQYSYSFWDSMIIDAAVKGGADLLLSEDLSHGQVVKGVSIKNPFLQE